MDFSTISVDLQNALIVTATLAGGLFLGRVLKYFLFRLIKWNGERLDSVILKSVVKHLSQPASFFIPLLVAYIVLPVAEVIAENSISYIETIQLILRIILCLVASWVVINSVEVFSDWIRHVYEIENADDLSERKLLTQLQFIKQFVVVVMSVVSIAYIMYQFEGGRELAQSLITSAGVVGIIVGLAAQQSITNLLAGFQIAFTQPIRLDDIVTVEGEYGTIEEITLTYVVVRIWDQRRLVVPLKFFIEKSFHNWTRTSTELLGTIFIYTDYQVPIQAIRDEANRILNNHEKWDKRARSVLVTDATENIVQIRILVSAKDTSDLYSLRCDIRERMITFVQTAYPESLPKTRVELSHPATKEF